MEMKNTEGKVTGNTEDVCHATKQILIWNTGGKT